MQHRVRFGLSGFDGLGFAKVSRWAKAALLLGTVLAAATASLHAQVVWEGAISTNLSNPLNWIGHLLPTSSSTITFGSSAVGASVNLDAAFTVDTVNFSGSTLFGINASNGDALTITTAVNNNSTGTGTILIAAPVILGGNVTVGGTSTTANLNVQNTVTGSGSLTLNLPSGRTLLLTHGGSYTGGTTLTAGTLTIGNGTVTGATLGGDVTGTANGILAFNMGSSDAVSYSGSASGSISITISGSSGVMTLAGLNTHSGQTLVASGTLTDGQAGSFSSNSILNLGSTSTLNVNYNETLGGLTSSGSGGTINIASGKTLTVNVGTTQGPFNGTLSGAGAFTKTGTGSIQLTNSSDFTGGTTISGGTIFATNSTGSALGTGAISVGANSTLQIGAAGGGSTGAVSGAVTLTSSSSNLNFNLTTNLTFSNGISGSGVVNQLGTGILTLGGTNTYGSAAVVSAGTLTDDADGSFSSSALIAVKSGANLLVNHNESIRGLQGSNGQGGTVTIASGKMLTLAPTGTRFFPGVITGAGALTIGGTVRQILTGINTYTGGTTINSGAILQIGNTDTNLPSPTLNVITDGSVTGAITNNGSLIFDQPDVGNNGITIGNAISGSGTVTFSGEGTVILPNANTYTGGTTISKGTVLLTNSTGSALGTGAVTVSSTSDTGILAGSASITGALTVGSGGVIFPGTFNNALGTMTPGVFGAGATTFASGGAFGFIVNDATGTEGSNWSLLNISGMLNITANSSTPFYVSVNSVDASNLPGQVVNFNSGQSYSWRIVTTTGGITGFSSDAFSTFTSAVGVDGPQGFMNSLGTSGIFFVTQSGNDLYLNFSPVPEPATWSLLAAGAVVLGGAGWRRRRSGDR